MSPKTPTGRDTNNAHCSHKQAQTACCECATAGQETGTLLSCRLYKIDFSFDVICITMIKESMALTALNHMGTCAAVCLVKVTGVLLACPLQVLAIYEPTVIATIIAPHQHCGAVMKLGAARRGTQLEYQFLGGSSNQHSSNGGTDSQLPSLQAAAAAAENSSSSSSSAFAGDMGGRVMLRYELPLSELAGDFYSKLKSLTQG